jgi:serine protease Do
MNRQRGQIAAVLLAALIGLLIGAALVWGWLGRREAARAEITVAPGGATRPPVSQEGQDAITAAVAKVGPAVVNIDTAYRPPAESGAERTLREMMGLPREPFPRAGQGSGFIIDHQNGYVLTNAHVVKNAAAIQVTLADGRGFQAKLVGSDPLSEVAVLKISGGKDLPQATLGTSTDLPIGAWVIAIGNPFGFENSVTVGVLSGKGRSVAGPGGVVLQDSLQTDASINPGNSGGALVDLNGNVVGIPTAMIPQAQGIGFAVPIDVAEQVAERLIKTGKMPWLGVSHRELLPRGAAALGVPDGKGSLIVQVIRTGPAERAGLQRGDVILKVNEARVSTSRDVGKLIRAHDAGSPVTITVWRDRRERKVEVILGAVPPNL